jgi:hypothetical protein
MLGTDSHISPYINARSGNGRYIAAIYNQIYKLMLFALLRSCGDLIIALLVIIMKYPILKNLLQIP